MGRWSRMPQQPEQVKEITAACGKWSSLLRRGCADPARPPAQAGLAPANSLGVRAAPSRARSRYPRAGQQQHVGPHTCIAPVAGSHGEAEPSPGAGITEGPTVPASGNCPPQPQPTPPAAPVTAHPVPAPGIASSATASAPGELPRRGRRQPLPVSGGTALSLWRLFFPSPHNF